MVGVSSKYDCPKKLKNYILEEHSMLEKVGLK
jgi:hypothetical protein